MDKQFEEMYDQVFDLIDRGRTAEAMDLAQKLVDANMSNEVAWFAYAYAKKAWGDMTLAVKGFASASLSTTTIGIARWLIFVNGPVG